MNGSRDVEVVGDFIEDGSFLVLSRDSHVNQQPSIPPNGQAQLNNSVPTSSTQFDYDANFSIESALASNLANSTTQRGSGGELPGSYFKSAQSSLNKTSLEKNDMKTSTHSSVISSASDISLEEVMKQMNSLKGENDTLKASLKDMNSTMKKNMEAFKEWQSTINTVHEDHQKKYEESRQLVESLREENSVLKLQTSMMGSQIQPGKNSEASFVQLGSIESQKNEELRRLQSQLDEHLALLEQEKLQNNQLKELLRVQNDSLAKEKQERARLVDELARKEEEMKSARVALDQTREYMNRSKEEYEKNREEIARLRGERDLARKALEEQGARDGLSLEQDMNSALESSYKRITNMQAALEKYVEEKEKLEAANARLTSELEQIEVLKHQVEVYKADFETEREGRANLAAIRDNLQRENEGLKEELVKKNEEMSQRANQIQQSKRLKLMKESIGRSHSNSLNASQREGDQSSGGVSSIPILGDVVHFFKNDVFGIGNASGSSSSSAVREDSPSNPHDLSEPCPICGMRFRGGATKLADHASDCGERDPFVFP